MLLCSFLFGQTTWIHVLPPLLISCVIMVKLLNFSVPQFLFRKLVCDGSCEFASSLLGNGDVGLESGLPHSQLTCS